MVDMGVPGESGGGGGRADRGAGGRGRRARGGRAWEAGGGGGSPGREAGSRWSTASGRPGVTYGSAERKVSEAVRWECSHGGAQGPDGFSSNGRGRGSV